MAQKDKERWEERYKKGWRSSLHKALLDFYHLAKVGRALELACGTGENALFSGKQGLFGGCHRYILYSHRNGKARGQGKWSKGQFYLCGLG